MAERGGIFHTSSHCTCNALINQFTWSVTSEGLYMFKISVISLLMFLWSLRAWSIHVSMQTLPKASSVSETEPTVALRLERDNGGTALKIAHLITALIVLHSRMEPFLLEEILARLQIWQWHYRWLSGCFLVLIFHLSHFMEDLKYIKAEWINIVEFKDTTVDLASHCEQTDTCDCEH